MKVVQTQPCQKTLLLLCVLCTSVVSCAALDREAFSIPKYDLNVQVDPEQSRLGVRGKITLRNDSAVPQKIAVLQISSSLDWRAIKAGNTALQFVRQPFTSDIDHTGSLSEAIVTLPREVAPHATIDLDIAYEGVIVLDATRLTRIGAPEDAAKSTDWDRIGPDFTAVRGAGYVAWYPIATDAANLSEGESLFEVLARWKDREAESEMSLSFESTKNSKILFSGTKDGSVVMTGKPEKLGAFSMIRPRTDVPTFVMADYKTTDIKGPYTIDFLPGKESIAASFADVLSGLNPLTGGPGGMGLQIAELPDSGAAKFVSQNLLLMPLRPMTEEDRLTLVYGLARQKAVSSRPWITEGLAHFAQVLDVEQEHGRNAALDYLNAHRSLLIESEKQNSMTEPSTSTASGENSGSHSLINATDEIYVQSKAMWVWWMLHDMLGGTAINLILSQYHAAADRDPSYMPKLVQKIAQRDLEWFFDDWVYRDHGLPDFRVESAFARKTMTDAYMLTVTLENQGNAGAEVPVVIKSAHGEVTKRIEIRAKSKTTVRVEMPGIPQEIQVNDGSVPESDTTNNTFKVPAPQE